MHRHRHANTHTCRWEVRTRMYILERMVKRKQCIQCVCICLFIVSPSWFNLDVLHYVKHVRLFRFLFSSNPQFGAHSISSSGFRSRRAIQMLFFLRIEEEKCLLFGKCLVLLLFFFFFFSCRFFCCLLLCNNQLVTVLCGLAKTVGNLLCTDCTVYLWLILLFIRLFHV